MTFYLMEPVVEPSTTIYEPIAEQVVRSVITKLGFEGIFKNNIYFNSPQEAFSRTVNDDGNRPLKENRLMCTTTTLLNPKNVNWDTINTYHTSSEGNFVKKFKYKWPAFLDRRNKLLLSIMEVPAMISIECEMRLVDRHLAYQVPSSMWSAFSNGDTIVTNDLMYDIALPKHTLYLMNELFKMTEYNGHIKFVDYLKKGSDGRISINVNKNIPIHKQIVLNKTLHNVLTKLEFTDPSGPDKNKKLPVKFNNNFTIMVQFSRASDCYFIFPIGINNKHVPKKFIPNYNLPPLPPKVDFYPNTPIMDFLKSSETFVRDNLLRFYTYDEIQQLVNDPECEALVKERWLRLEYDHILRVPTYDNWKAFDIHHPHPDFYKPFAILAFTLTVNDQGVIEDTVIDLANFMKDELKLSTDLLNILKTEGNKLLFAGEPVHVQVYRDSDQYEPAYTSIIDGVLTVKSTALHKIHRIVFYIKSERGEYGFVPINRITIFEITALREFITESRNERIIR